MAGAIRSKKIGSCFEWLELSVKKKLGAVRTAGAIPFKKVVSCLNWMFVANGWRYVLKPQLTIPLEGMFRAVILSKLIVFALRSVKSTSDRLKLVQNRRIKTIQHVLSKPETERHLCALKLLPHFFSKEELAESNTDGIHDKKCLDSVKLNLLKLLVFSKFPVSKSEEKDKAWRNIKGKIYSKCRATRKVLMSDFTPPRSL